MDTVIDWSNDFYTRLFFVYVRFQLYTSFVFVDPSFDVSVFFSFRLDRLCPFTLSNFSFFFLCISSLKLIESNLVTNCLVIVASLLRNIIIYIWNRNGKLRQLFPQIILCVCVCVYVCMYRLLWTEECPPAENSKVVLNKILSHSIDKDYMNTRTFSYINCFVLNSSF